MASQSSTTSATEAGLIELYERIRPQPMAGRERMVEAAVGAAALAATLTVALTVHAERHLNLGSAALFVLAFALAKQIRFAVGASHASPTQLVLVPMLFLLPTPVVPLLVTLGMLASHLPDYVARRTHPDRALLVAGDSAYSLAPALVLSLAGSQLPHWSSLPMLAAAMGAQVVADAGIATCREWLAFGVPPGIQPLLSSWVAVVDLLLAPVGFMAALAGAQHTGGWLLVLPLLALVAVFARERKARVEHALELGRAYRGTTLLLSDVLEADDEYTGNHSWGVVALALRVADAMGLNPDQRRNVEFGALLHDIGKIAVPKEIINKPGKLTDEEWLVIKTHTVEGERMLQRVGGVLGEVGRIVRSSHERWDGGGYPDGLRGEQIPIEACIVSCCDAFDAMTTNRSYRAAMPLERALAELEANAGTQFNPGVVKVVTALTSQGTAAPAAEPSAPAPVVVNSPATA
ncbi:MAG TPA: HD-GYP domain-containing protein [Thermoleophilaceae bacterium]|nr:HD-GYP domain-containing protein [Thermoleophilaceae bacterium]